MSINHIPETDLENGLTGYYKSAAIGAYKLTINGQKLFYGMLLPKDENIEAIRYINPNDFPFKDWKYSDLTRLGYEEQLYNEDGTPWEPSDFDFSGFTSKGNNFGRGFREIFDDLFCEKSAEENPSAKPPPQSKASDPTPNAKPDDNDPFGGIGRKGKKAKGKDKGTFTKEDLEKSIQNGRWDA
jgi:hypothetical protein